jgi:predicted nuclease with TOPRIM domain
MEHSVPSGHEQGLQQLRAENLELQADLIEARSSFAEVRRECELQRAAVEELRARVAALQADRQILIEAHRQAQNELARIRRCLDDMLKDIPNPT